MDDFYDFIFEAPQSSAPAEAPLEPRFQTPAEPIVAKSEQKKKRGSRTALKMVALALVCSLLGGAVGASAVALGNAAVNGVTAALQQTTDVQVSSREGVSLNLVSKEIGEQLTPAEVYAKNVASTVGITTEIQTTNYWGYGYSAQVAGSGFVFSDDGYILTNYHVVEGASSSTVTLYNDEQYPAELVGYDEDNDVAVLKIDAEGLVPVTIGDSDALNVGDSVLAIGNPLGELTFSLTSGVVSALERDVTLSSGTMSLIQTDCAINSGNSGGALFNLYGEVVGITNAKYSSSGYSSEASIDNIAFAIPINRAMRIARSILENGYYSKPYLGVMIQTVAADSETGAPAGVRIASVNSGSPAEQGGLREGDIVTALGDRQLQTNSELVALVADSVPGEVLTLTVWRNGKTLTLDVTVGTQDTGHTAS